MFHVYSAQKALLFNGYDDDGGWRLWSSEHLPDVDGQVMRLGGERSCRDEVYDVTLEREQMVCDAWLCL